AAPRVETTRVCFPRRGRMAGSVRRCSKEVGPVARPRCREATCPRDRRQWSCCQIATSAGGIDPAGISVWAVCLPTVGGAGYRVFIEIPGTCHNRPLGGNLMPDYAVGTLKHWRRGYWFGAVLTLSIMGFGPLS